MDEWAEPKDDNQKIGGLNLWIIFLRAASSQEGGQRKRRCDVTGFLQPITSHELVARSPAHFACRERFVSVAGTYCGRKFRLLLLKQVQDPAVSQLLSFQRRKDALESRQERLLIQMAV
jgi:hypothetical protein